MSSINDFVIENDVLKKYTGKDSVVTIPEGVTSIENMAFSKCSSLTSVLIPNSVRRLGTWVFGGCSNLASIIIPDGVLSIGACTFYDCYKLTSVTIPDSVKEIEYCAFEKCASLTRITIPDSVKEIGWGAFDGCISLISITIPNGVTRIDEATFRECTNLESVTIPNSVTIIGDEVFIGCISLTNITIPNSVTSIGDRAFRDSGLKDVYYKGTEQQWDNIKWESQCFLKNYLPNVRVHFNCKYSNDLSEIEKEVRRLLSEGKSEKEVYKALKSKSNIADKDIVDALLRIDSTSPMVVSFCDKVILPDISSLFQKSNGVSKYTIGEVANILYNKYPRALVNEAIVKVLHNEYLVD